MASICENTGFDSGCDRGSGAFHFIPPKCITDSPQCPAVALSSPDTRQHGKSLLLVLVSELFAISPLLLFRPLRHLQHAH